MARTALAYMLLIAALAVSNSVWLVAVLTGLVAMCISGMFVLAHDAAHQALFTSSRVNAVVGRLLMLPELHVFSGWVVGHNRLHHRHTLRRNADFVWHPLTPDEYSRLPRVLRWRHRLEWSVVGSGLYYTRVVWWNHMMRQKPPARHVRQVRADRMLVVGFALVCSSAAAVVGALRTGSVAGAVVAPVKLFLLPLLIFNAVLGWAVHVQHIGPTIRWREGGQEELTTADTTTVLRAPWPLDVVWFNIFLHVPHHLDPRVPCYRLRPAVAALLANFPGVVVERKLRLRDYWAATRACKVYDYDSRRWLRYRDLHPRSSARH